MFAIPYSPDDDDVDNSELHRVDDELYDGAGGTRSLSSSC